MKAVRYIGIFIILIVTASCASADVVLTTAYSANQGIMQVNVIYNVQNSTITFLDQSNGLTNPGILGIAYNLNTDAQQISGYGLNSDSEQILYSANSGEQNGNVWVKKTEASSAGDVGNLLRFYSANTGNVNRFHKIVVKLPSLNGIIPPDSKNNQVGVQFVCDQFTTFVAGPGNSGTTNNPGGSGTINNPGNSGTSNSNSGLKLEITVETQTYNAVDQTISYNFVVKNTGDLPVTGLSIQDDKLGTISISDIAVGSTVSVGSVYKIKQTDLDTGFIASTAYATGTCNGNIIQSNAVTTNITANRQALRLEETASPTTYEAAGQIITYSYTIINSGNVQISGPISLTNNKTDNGLPISVSQSGLAPGGLISFTKSYTITDADLNAGSVTNLANASGTYNSNLVKSNDATATVTAYKSALSIMGEATPENFSTEGQEIKYNYVVTNSGNVPIAGITVTDNESGTLAASGTELAPHSSLSISSTRKITKADLDAGSVTTQTSATGEFNGKKLMSNIETIEIKADTEIPEFPSIILPVVAILGLLFISQNRRKER